MKSCKALSWYGSLDTAYRANNNISNFQVSLCLSCIIVVIENRFYSPITTVPVSTKHGTKQSFIDEFEFHTMKDEKHMNALTI